MTYIHRCGAVILALVLTGCIHSLTVTKVDKPDPNLDPSVQTSTVTGQRFALPIPVIVVTPKNDGSMEVKEQYFADQDNTFAIHSETHLGKNTLDVSTTDGIIESITIGSDSTAVAGSTIGAVGAVETEKLKARIEAAKKESDDQKADAKALAAAELALSKACARLEIAKKLTDQNSRAAQVFAAEQAVSDAWLTLRQLDPEAVHPCDGGGTPTGDDPVDESPTADDPAAGGPGPANSKSADADFARIPGPKFYGIEEKWVNGKLSVKLVPMGKQIRSRVGRGRPVDVPPPAETPNWTELPPLRATKDESGAYVATWSLTGAINRITERELVNIDTTVPVSAETFSVKPEVKDGTTKLSFTADGSLAAARYRLIISFEFGVSGEGELSAEVDLQP